MGNKKTIGVILNHYTHKEYRESNHMLFEMERWRDRHGNTGLGSTEIHILYIYDYSTIAKEVSGEGCLTSCGDPPVGSISREQHHQTGDAVHPVNEARKCSEEIHYISTAQVTTNFFATYSFQPNVQTGSKFHYQATSQLGRHCINSPYTAASCNIMAGTLSPE